MTYRPVRPPTVPMRYVVLCLVLVAPLHAADLEVGGQHGMAVPRGQSGDLDIATGRGFGAHVEVFWSERLSARLSAFLVNPAVHRAGVDLGTLGLDIYAATARFHLRPGRGLSAFVGGGPAYVVIGDLDDQFGDDVAIEFDPRTTFAVEGGLRYRIHPRVVLEGGATYVPVELPLSPEAAVDPLIVSAGAAWRF